MTIRGWNPAAFDRWLTTQPEAPCDWCGGLEQCEDDCECPDCESERAAQDDHDASEDRWKNQDVPPCVVAAEGVE